MAAQDRLALLRARLGEAQPDTPALEAALDEAELELRAWLGYLTGPLPEVFAPKVVALAAIYCRRDALAAAHPGQSQQAVTEGQLSQSVTWYRPEDWESQAAGLLRSLARYRRVTL